MTKKIAILLPVAAIAFLMFSCIESDEDDNTGIPSCVITSFAVGDIKSDYATKTINGKDTTYARTISGKNIHFNIDQVNGRITTVDSLAYWVNLKKVVPTINGIGTAYYRKAGTTDDYVFLRSGSDSIDFTSGIELKVVSSDGNYSRDYIVNILKSRYETEALNWEQLKANSDIQGAHRTLSANGKLYVFAEDAGNSMLTVGTPNDNDVEWGSTTTTNRFVDYKSVTVFNGSFYAIDQNHQLCFSEDGADWSVTSSTVIDRLLAADKTKLYAFDGTSVISTADGTSWEEETAADINNLPQMPVSYAAYALSTNSNLQNVVMTGCNSTLSSTPVWFKLSASSNESDQNWAYINITDDNPYALPVFDYVQMVRYDGVLLAAGKGSADGNYAHIYMSPDNGVTWHVDDNTYRMISGIAGSELPISMTVCGDYIYLIQAGGAVWRGVK